MEWLEVSIQVNGEAAEAVAEVLSRYAPQGVAFDFGIDDSVPDAPPESVHTEPASPITVKAYLTVDEDIDEHRREVEAGLGHLRHIWPVIPEPVFTPVQDQDWTALWKEQIPVLHLGQRVVIKPSWRSYTPAPEELILEMDPGMAFGTGLHPTTQLCMLATEALVTPGAEVLDLGTGTGILAMAAAKLGAGHIVAVDNNEDAVIAARRNAAANQLSNQIELIHGSLEDVTVAYDLVLANILAPIIISMAKSGLAERVRHGGTLVASGILEEQADEVTCALEATGLQVTERRQQDEWMVLVAVRS